MRAQPESTLGGSDDGSYAGAGPGHAVTIDLVQLNTNAQPAAPAVSLVWQDVHVVAKRQRKVLLGASSPCSGSITNGFNAIMGPSGSGKTTLLNTLACRLDRDTRVTGELRLNGQTYSQKALKAIGGYVMQDDVLNTALTVKETLDFTAELRLPARTTREERDQEVERVLLEMGLLHTKSTIIGNPMQKGISGGERKRVCVAMELLTRPLLLFLDEPTSGLDSVSALSIATTLRYMAAQGTCTVVCTIHQPQAKIFNLFDNLFLLKSGNIVYQGAADKALDYFSKLGFECPLHENPANHLMDVITPAFKDSTHDLQALEEKFQKAYVAPEVDLHAGADRPLYMVREVVPWHHQFLVLLRRSIKEQWRERSTLITSLVQTIIMAVLIGTTWLQIGTGQSSVAQRQPVLFFCTINQGTFGALAIINSFPAERMLSLRERAAGSYYVSAYFLAKSTAEMMFQVAIPVLFTSTLYFLVGFQPIASKFFIFLAFMVLCNLSAMSLAVMISAIFRTTDMSVVILPLVLELSRLFGTFYVAPANMPVYFTWLEALSYCTYSYLGTSLNELQGLTLTCTPSQRLANGQCPVPDGEYTIKQLGLNYLSIGQCAGILISYIVICRLIAYLALRYIKW